MKHQAASYQCPGCTAPLRYEPRCEKLVCDYCSGQYTVEEIEGLYPQQEIESPSYTEKSWGEDEGQMRAYSCASCGAELICEETTAAVSCPYCGNHAIISVQFAGELRPDYVIPFALSRENAVAALRKSCRHRLLLPKEFGRESCLQKITGVYVPFWLFDGLARADVTFDGERESEMSSPDENEILIEHYEVHREGYVRFSHVPVDASAKMRNDYMDAIEPYDYTALKPFSMGYLPGFLANRYDVDRESAYKRAERRMKQSAIYAMMDTVEDFNRLRVTKDMTTVKRKKTDYALLPVWMLHGVYDGEEYRFAVNGQTGKTVGRFPICPKKLHACLWGIGAGLAVGIGAVLTAVLTYLL